MFLKKSLSFFATVLSFFLFSCELFSSFSDGYNPVTRFSFAANSVTVAAGNFQQIPIVCKPDSEQPKLGISWSYDESVIALVPDNFTPAVYGIKAGSSVLKASINGFSTSCVVTVTGSSPSAVITPYVYSSASFVPLTPDGEQVRVTASLAGGTPSDISGFSFEAEHSGIVSIVSEGNAAWLRGISPGMTRVTIRHSRSSFPYAFIVSCSADSVNVPYITTESNIVTVNKSAASETSFSVSMANSNSFIYDSGYRFELLDSQYSPAADPPVAISANGRNCIVTPLKAGECFVRVSHDSPEVFYPLDVLVIVYEQIENAYIEIPEPIVYVSGSSAATFSVSLANLPGGVSADPSGFVWTFPDNAASFVDFNIYGGGSFGTGNSLWLSGKKSGSFPVSVAHPLAPNKRTFYVVVRNIAGEAVDASAYITTSQNYVLAAAGSDPVSIMVVLYNIEQGGENLLAWSVEHTAADGSANPVLEYASATGSYTSSFSRASSARSARSLNYAPTTTGSLTITPLREGTAVISVSHPKAFYDTKILVNVLPENEPVAEKPFLLSSFNLLTALLNGESAAIDVSLVGGSVSAADESAVSWSPSDPSRLSITSSGTSAFISACGTGFSRNTVTVTHPKALSPLILTVICADDEAQITAAKYVLSMNYSYVIEEGQQVYISAFINNEEPGDSLVWSVPSGLNSVVGIAQTDPRTVSVTGLKNGLAAVTASIAGNSDPNAAASFQILVSSAASPPSHAAYLTTSDNVIVLLPYEEKSVSVSSVNVPMDYRLSWSGYDSSLIELVPNNNTAVIRAKGKTGSTSATVSHPKSSNSIAINIRVGDRYIYENTNLAYIAVPADTLVLSARGQERQFQVVLAYTETADTSASGFSFSSSKPSVVALDHFPGSGTVFVKPLAAGQSVLTVSHPDAPDREVLVIVERAEGDSPDTPYITSKQNIVTVTSGGTAVVSASLVNALSYNNSEWRWNSSSPASVSIVANNGPTAVIRGYNPGQAVIAVSHDKAPHPLTLTVLCVDSVVAASQPWINTNFSIINLKVGRSETLSAEMIGGSGSDNSAFRFTASSQSVLFMNQSGSSAYLRGVATGTATVTVTNIMYPVTHPGNRKTVLVIVEPDVNDDVYISPDRRFIHLQPDSTAGAVVTASLFGPNTSAADNFAFSWWADDYSLVHLNSVSNSASVTPTGKTGVTAVHVKHPKAAYAAEIIVMVSKYSEFAFADASKSVPRGGTAFIPMRVPPQSANYKVEYASANPAVCEIVGSSSTAMIAGISHGQTIVSASLKTNGQTVATAELAVIVGYASPNGNSIAVQSAIVNLEPGQKHTLKALLSGPDISDQDKYSILWESGDSSVASLLATENNLTKGPEALLTAAGPGETFIAVSHDKVRYEISSLHPRAERIIEYILVIVPRQNEKIITLSQTSLVMYKDEPDVKISATVLNGTQADYSAITWSAPRVSGQNILSIRGNGRDCNIHPLNTGTTTLRAQLPNGVYADCIVSVQSASGIALSTAAVHLNPGYSQTVPFSVNPDNALVQWNAVVNGSMLPNDEFFSFSVDNAAKTITVTAKEIGSGYIQGIMLSGGQGATTARLNVFVEYNYSFELNAAAVISVEPYPGTIIEIPFRVFPPDLSVETLIPPDVNEKYLRLYSFFHNSATGDGVIRLEAIAEKEALTVTARAFNPKDQKMQPISRPVSLKLMYENVSITPRFKTQTGSFSEFKKNPNSANWELRLGDGEDALFYLDIDKENADVSNVKIAYEVIGNKTIHNARSDDTGTKFDKTTGEIAGPQASGSSVKNGGYIVAGQGQAGRWDAETDPETGRPLYRIRHTNDERKGAYYAITKDLYYRNILEERFGGNASALAGADYSFRYLDPPPYVGGVPDYSYNTITAVPFIEGREDGQDGVNLSSASGGSIVPVLVGSPATVSVSLSGDYSMADLLNIQWESSDPAFIAAAGARGPDFTVLVPNGPGPKKTTLTASLGFKSFSFLIVSADTPEELASMKAFHCPKTALRLGAGETARIDIEHFGYTPQDIESLNLQTVMYQPNYSDVYWLYDSGNGIINIIFDPNNPLSATVSALSPGSYGFAVSRWEQDSGYFSLEEICNVNVSVTSTSFPIVWSVSPLNQSVVAVEYSPDGSAAVRPLGQGVVKLTADVPGENLSTTVSITVSAAAKTASASVAYGSNGDGLTLGCYLSADGLVEYADRFNNTGAKTRQLVSSYPGPISAKTGQGFTSYDYYIWHEYYNLATYNLSTYRTKSWDYRLLASNALLAKFAQVEKNMADNISHIKQKENVVERPFSITERTTKRVQNPQGQGASMWRTVTTYVTTDYAYSVDFHYQDCAPYVIPAKEFEDNPNYYLPEKKNYVSIWEWNLAGQRQGDNYGYKSLPEYILHKYATPTCTKDQKVTDTAIGLITVTFTRHNKTETQQIYVYVEVRDCEAYSKGRWAQTPGAGMNHWTMVPNP